MIDIESLLKIFAVRTAFISISQDEYTEFVQDTIQLVVNRFTEKDLI